MSSEQYLLKFWRKKPSVCGTCSRNETSLNAIARENVRVYINRYEKFFLKFLKFFQKLHSNYIFIIYTNLSKLVKIIFDTNLNFIKVSNTSKIFWKKVYLKNIQNFLEFFPNIPAIFFQNFTKYYSRLILFSNFHGIFSTVPQFLISLLTFYRVSRQFLQFFFKGLLESLHKVIVKICPNFYSGLLTNFLVDSEVFLNFFVALKLFFSRN